jgi:hypothetical protein
MVAAPKALRARPARDHTDDRGTSVGIGAVPRALMDTAAAGIEGGAREPAFVRYVMAQLVRVTAVPIITSMGAGSFTLVWMRYRRRWSWWCDTPRARARRAIGSPRAIPTAALGSPAVAESGQRRDRCDE